MLNQPAYILGIHYWVKEMDAESRGLERETWKYHTLKELYFSLAGIEEEV